MSDNSEAEPLLAAAPVQAGWAEPPDVPWTVVPCLEAFENGWDVRRFEGP